MKTIALYSNDIITDLNYCSEQDVQNNALAPWKRGQ